MVSHGFKVVRNGFRNPPHYVAPRENIPAHNCFFSSFGFARCTTPTTCWIAFPLKYHGFWVISPAQITTPGTEQPQFPHQKKRHQPHFGLKPTAKQTSRSRRLPFFLSKSARLDRWIDPSNVARPFLPNFPTRKPRKLPRRAADPLHHDLELRGHGERHLCPSRGGEGGAPHPKRATRFLFFFQNKQPEKKCGVPDGCDFRLDPTQIAMFLLVCP